MPDIEVDVPGPPLPEGEETLPQARSAADERILALPPPGQGAEPQRNIEEVIADERFIDTLADKIALRMAGAGMSPNSTFRRGTQGTGAKGSWADGVLSGKETIDGQPTAHILHPEPPSFTEPDDERSKAELPRALQGSLAPGAPPTEQETTSSDSNDFTQEKMRGDCYVRLLYRPEPFAARKKIQPYLPEANPPDPDLISKRSRPYVRMAPKAPVIDENGEILEEDEFEDFEKNSDIVFSFVRHNRYDAVEALIQQDRDIVRVSDQRSGNGLLHVACQNNNRRLVKLILKTLQTGDESKLIDMQNHRGNTALHYCFQYTFTDLADYLISKGADESILNEDGKLPAQGTGRKENVPVNQGQHAARGVG
jgi:hypothetical protein